MALTGSGPSRSLVGTSLEARRLTTAVLSVSTLTTGPIVASVTTNITVSSNQLSVTSLVVNTVTFTHNASQSTAMFYPLGVGVTSTQAPGSFSVGTIPGMYSGCLAFLYGIRSNASLTASAGATIRFVANGDILSRDWKCDYFNTGTAMLTFSANEGVPPNSFRKSLYFGSVSALTYDTNLIWYNEGPFSAVGTPTVRGFRVGPSGTSVWCSVSAANVTSASLTLYFLAIPSLTAM